MAEFRLIKTGGIAPSIYPAQESRRALRKLLNRAWDKGIQYYVGYWRPLRLRRIQRDKDVSKILEEAKKPTVHPLVLLSRMNESGAENATGGPRWK